jgi:protein SCO1/2
MLKNRLAIVGISTVLIAAALLILQPATTAGADASSHFPNVELITQDSKKVHFYDDLIKGKIVAIDLIYTSCQYACPLETARLAQIQKKLGDRVGQDIFFYSITIDPEHDTPEVLKAYAEKFHAGPGWLFLTGKKEDIMFLGKRLGLYTDADAVGNPDGHVAHLLIGNETTGQWMRGSALDSPSFQARMIGEFLDNFKHSNLADKGSGDGSAIKNFDQGKYLFGRDCLPCHTVGQGDKIGPDLLGVTRTREPKWLARMIQHPDQLLSENDPLALALLKKYNNVRMPNIWLNEDEMKTVLGYIEARTAAHEKEAAVTDGAAHKN